MYWNWVLTSGLIPTPPTPGWKLPEAVGSRSPIFNVDFTLSTARNSGACSTVVSASLREACSSALGRVVEKSALERWPSTLRGMALVPVVLAVVPVVVVGVVVVVAVVLVDDVVAVVVPVVLFA